MPHRAATLRGDPDSAFTAQAAMRREEVLKLLESAGAIRQGHFELSSGLHSGTYVQCALVLQHPRYAEQLGRADRKSVV